MTDLEVTLKNERRYLLEKELIEAFIAAGGTLPFLGDVGITT